jgi:hypothetical protein
MANEATGQSDAEQEAERSEESGRFPIPMSGQPILPPPGPDDATGDDSAPLDADLESVLVEAAAAPAAERPKTLPPPVPPPSTRPPSIRPASMKPVMIEVVAPATKPQYSGIKVSDRADVRVDDLSLELEHNPYTRSSLVPPPKPPLPVAAWLSGAAVGASVAVAVMLALQSRGNPGAQVAVQPQAPVAVAAVIPSVVAAPVVSAPEPADEPVPEPVTAVAAEAVPPADPTPAGVVPAAVPVPESKVVPTPVTAKPAPAAEVQAPHIAEATSESAATVEPQVQPPSEAATAAAPVVETATAVAAEGAGSATAEVASPATDAPSELPETLSREAVMTGFEALRADITACAAGGHGKVSVKTTIAGSGRVTYAMVEGAFAGTPEGSCMALVVRKATFPTFTAPTLKVTYPFAL